MTSTFASQLGIEHPLIQAPMSGSTPPALVAAVSNAGALGSLGAGYLEPSAIIENAEQIRASTGQPYAIGLFVLPDEFDADMAAVAKAREQLDQLMAREGIEQPMAKKLVGELKAAKLKVEAQINGDKLRVSGKKRDDLQAAMALLRKSEVELPLQFDNFRD